jgi:hypothetical protein
MPVFDQPECQDGIMLVTPRPGVDRENLLKTLQSVYTDVYNLRGAGGAARNAYERLQAYVEWTSTAVRMLGKQVSNGDLDRLVLTERYRLLLAGLVGTATSTELPVQRVVSGLVSLELDERAADFDAAIKALQGQIARWSAYGHYVIPDTGFYIHHKDKLKAVDFGPLINVWPSKAAVLVPIVMCGCRATTTKSSTGPWLSRHWRTARSRCSPTTPVSPHEHVTLASRSSSLTWDKIRA